VKLEERRRIHDLTEEQLKGELAEAERDLLTHRFDAGLKRLTNPAALHNARKRIAMLKTLLRQRALLAEHGFATMDEYKVYRVAERREYRARKAE
jgi:ribosomal protein L29